MGGDPIAFQFNGHISKNLSENVCNHVSGNVGETVIAPLLTPGESLVVQSELVQDCGIEVMDVDRFIHGSKSKLIRRAIRHTSFDSPASEPY
jgi:hypothetical protein